MLKMTVEIARKIADISAKPGVSNRTQFILVLHAVRNLVRHRKEIRHERNVFRREAAILEACTPSAAPQIEELKSKARSHRAEEFDGNKQVLIGMGNMLLHDREGSYDSLGFDAVCDLIGVNPVHRAGIDLRGGSRGLAELIYVSRMENSSGPNPDGWGEGGPLYEACFAATCHWIRTAPKEDLPDLFGPGSPFYGAKLVEVKAGVLH
ncbi:hypothetical protein [Pseudomonas fluorescens]|uniref:Uncharacterized protein n=1 Tax=Pseudomonas fluorescens TaxID=294 RepID=A0A5E7E8K6_PSEFL|nr:hypothetical protein [Pseudomonas fluorescens]VVO22942.1 hypothetical protein PS723_04363 [Pseudomonas fluorescens]